MSGLFKAVWPSRRSRNAILLMVLLGSLAIYVSGGYIGVLFAERDTLMHHSSIRNVEETMRAIDVIERNVKVQRPADSNRFDENNNELFVRHKPEGGTELFVFSTKKVLTPQERLMLSTTTMRPSRSRAGSSTTSQGLIPQQRRVGAAAVLTTRPSRSNQRSTTNSRNPVVGVVLQPRKPSQIPANSISNQSHLNFAVDTAAQAKLTDATIVSDLNNVAHEPSTFISTPSVEIVPRVRVTDVNCAKLFDNDAEEYRKASTYQRQNLKVPIPDEEYPKLTRDCNRFVKQRQYIMQPLSQIEADFPIAFSMLVFKDVEQVERLLRAIYRPQNFYCIHVDRKSPQQVQDSIKGLASCFDNVFLASRSVNVQWGWWSVLEPEFTCMEDLIKYKWKYFINLTGQEWPLKTNEDLVKILKAFNGANSMEGTVKRRNVERTQYKHEGYYATYTRKSVPPPAGIRLTKGSVHITVSRAFVEYVLRDPVALEFRDWLKDTGVPDETFFASLSHSPELGVPGAYKGEPETDPVKYPFITRFKNWGVYPFDYPCKGQRVRMVCIWSVGDLPTLKTRPELFTNKFYLDYEPLALDCMEELHYNRTREAILGERKFSTLYYQNLGFVKNHV